jgi:hypothetical protein
MELRVLARPAALAVAGGLLAALPAAADFRLERQLALTPGGEVVVESSGGGVTVVGDSPNGVQVLITADDDDVAERYTFDFDVQPGRVTITNKRKRGSKGWFDWDWSSGGIHIEVRVPHETALDVSSSGGGIRASQVEGDVRLRSSGGGVRVFDVDGMVDAESSGGPVEARRVEGEVRVSSSGGGVKVGEVIGNVEAGSSGGGVTIENVAGDVDASSSGGGVRVALMPTAHVTVDAASSGGGVTCDLPITVRGKIGRDSLRGQINGGGHVYRLRSSGGGIRIRPTGDDTD